MYHTEDWEHITACMTAWWRREYETPLAQATSPKSGGSAIGFDWWALVRPGAEMDRVRDAFLTLD